MKNKPHESPNCHCRPCVAWVMKREFEDWAAAISLAVEEVKVSEPGVFYLISMPFPTPRPAKKEA